MHQPEESSSTLQSPKLSFSKPKGKKIVVICNHITSKRDSNRYRLSEPKSAKVFLSVHNFNKDAVHTSCTLYQAVKDHFAAVQCIIRTVCLPIS